jgi:hypothetical protein
MIIGFVGFIGSGKDTAADYLVNFHGFRRDSFASTLKDAVACVFGWDRTLLEGRTKESREWREQQDDWWTDRLGQPITPRWILQHWGTEVCRNGFHNDIWIASLENKIRKTNDNVVITDVRFPNEIAAIKNSGGKVFRIKRGLDPEWYQDAINFNQGPTNMTWAISKMRLDQAKVHASESSWVGNKGIDLEIDNDGTIDDLYNQLRNQVEDPLDAIDRALYVGLADNLHTPSLD